METTDTHSAGVADLDTLTAGLDPGAFAAAIVRSGRSVCLRVTSRRNSRLTEDVYAGLGFFWWSWAEKIAPIDDVTGAAAKVATVLSAVTEPAR